MSAMRLSKPFSTQGEHIAAHLPGACVLFTTRHGGVSCGPYATLNLGRLTGDDAAAVDANRRRLADQLGQPLSVIRQVHGIRVKRLQRTEDFAPAAPALEEADGQALAVSGVAALVTVADCLPIALGGGGAGAILHAGWRGLADGVVAAGLRAVRELGGGDEVEAAIGPGAGACCYEVGEEVHARFTAYGSRARRGANLDLKSIAAAQLEACGVRVVHDVGLCTICGPALFFSHRRDRGTTGRQAGVVWLS